MIEKDKNYFINNPIFIKYKTRFSFLKGTRIRRVKKVFINERIVEIPFVFQSLPKDKNIKILDLGSTESSLTLHLANLGYNVVGLDSRPFPYVHPNFRFIQSDILNLPFEEEEFDVVSCISTLEHIGLGYYRDSLLKEQPDIKALAQIKRVLKEKGLLILSVPFGICQQTPQQRIYDSEKLNYLLKDFSVEEKIFFANCSDSKNNYWQKLSEEEASKIKSLDGSTNCVCLIRAQK